MRVTGTILMWNEKPNFRSKLQVSVALLIRRMTATTAPVRSNHETLNELTHSCSGIINERPWLNGQRKNLVLRLGHRWKNRMNSTEKLTPKFFRVDRVNVSRVSTPAGILGPLVRRRSGGLTADKVTLFVFVDHLRELQSRRGRRSKRTRLALGSGPIAKTSHKHHVGCESQLFSVQLVAAPGCTGCAG
jgi:hypothetical protein